MSSLKLICAILLLVLITVFCGFNNGEGHQCSVHLLFHSFDNVPVFLTVLVSFLAGAVVALPFTFGRRVKKQPKVPKSEKAKKTPQESRAEQRDETVSAPDAAYRAPANDQPLPSPFKQAHENAKHARERARAERAQKRAEKAKVSAAKKARAGNGEKKPSPNDVPKVYATGAATDGGAPRP